MTDTPMTPRAQGDKDAPHMSPVDPDEDARTILINRISWGAVFAGVVIALVVQLLLNMLGIGVGAATIDPDIGESPAFENLSIGGALWWIISGIIAAFVGGFAAGRLSGRPKESTTGWHGLVSWALSTLIVFFLLTSVVGGIVGGAFSTVGGAVGGLARTTMEAAVPAIAGVDDPFAAIERQIRAASGGTDPSELREVAVISVRAAITGDEAQAEEARRRAAEVLARAQNISPEEAQRQIAQYEDQYRQAVTQAREEARQAASVAADAAAQAAIYAFIALVLGAIAAWFGGRFGTVSPTITGTRRPF